MARHRKLTQKFAGFPMFKLATSGDTFPVTSSFTTGFTGLVNDELALDLQFATDKTLTARKGPTPAFTRGSSATQVGASGLIEYAPENLILQSETLGTAWTLNNATISSDVIASPSGAVTADRIIENTAVSATHGIDQTITLTGVTHTFSFYAKKGERIWVRGFFGGLGSTWFNLDTGTIGTVDSGVSATMQSAGNGWWRCALTGVPTGTLHGIRIATGDTISSYTGDGVSGLYVWGTQIERSSIARAYNPTTTAAFQGPRFDHDPVTLACKGLLIEESRTNAALYSGSIVNNIGWGVSATTSIVDGIGPDGGNAYSITETTATAPHTFVNSGSTTSTAATSVTSGTVYTCSIFLKKVTGSVDWVQLTLGSVGFGTAQYANFNIGNGTVGNSAGLASGTSPRIEDYGNGWYRCSISVAATTTTTATSGTIIGFIQNTNGTTRIPSYAGSTSNSVLASLCQFEAGSFPTSYIPTTTASVIRSADVCSITGSAFSGFYNQPEGTLFADVTPQTVAQIVPVLTVNTTTFNQSHAIFKGDSSFNNPGRKWGVATVSTAIVSVIATSTDVATTRSRLAYAYKLNDMALAASGSLIGTDTSGTMPSPTAMHIGMRDAALQINGHLASIRYFKKRLSNAKLASLTV